MGEKADKKVGEREKNAMKNEKKGTDKNKRRERGGAKKTTEKSEGMEKRFPHFRFTIHSTSPLSGLNPYNRFNKSFPSQTRFLPRD